MRTAGIAFAAGLAGSLSGWFLAASLGAAAPDDEKPDAADADKPTPQLALRSTALVEGPLVELAYGAVGGTAGTVTGDAEQAKDSFVWVYPDWVVTGPLSGNEVTVIPRDHIDLLRIDDVSAGPRQTYREQATQLRRSTGKASEKENKADAAKKPAEKNPE